MVLQKKSSPVHLKDLFWLIVWIQEVSCAKLIDYTLINTALLFHICSMCTLYIVYIILTVF